MAERSVNKAILVGRLGADAETRFTQSGTPVSRVSLAMNRQWTDSDKQVREETDWMSIVIWNKENLATYLTKGTKLYVEGRLQTRSYDDKEGVKRYVTEVVAENLVLLGGTASSNSNGNGGGGRERSTRRPTPGKPANGHRDRAPEPAEQGLQDDDVPFWVNLVSASAPSLPTRIALFTLRSAIEFSFLFEISDYVLRLQYDFAAKTLQGRS